MFIEIIFLVLGLYMIVGIGIFNLGMDGRRAQRMVRLIGVAGAKIFYMIIGIVFIATAIASFMGVINLG